MESGDREEIPFKVFGLHRSGTNLAVALVERNFHVHSLEVGAEWKHGPVKFPDRSWNDRPARFVLCVKNPYAWLVSCYRCFHRALNSDRSVPGQFKRDPSIPFHEFVISPNYESRTPVDRWNEMYRLWLSFLPSSRTVIIRQEDQLSHQRLVLERVERELGLARRDDGLHEIKGHVDVGGSISGPMNTDYYVDREYMTEYAPLLLERVNHLLDWELMQRFGYQREEVTLEQRQLKGQPFVVRPCTSDAGDVLEAAADPYGLGQIKSWGGEVRVALDVGAHIGQTTATIKKSWPDARIVAYEPSPDNHRLLRINLRRFSRTTAVRAALWDRDSGKTGFTSIDFRTGMFAQTGDGVLRPEGSDQVVAVAVGEALSNAGEVDLLKIGCVQATLPILNWLLASGSIKSIPWICARVRGFDRQDAVIDRISGTHSVKISENSAGKFLLCSRSGLAKNPAPRIRSDRLEAGRM